MQHDQLIVFDLDDTLAGIPVTYIGGRDPRSWNFIDPLVASDPNQIVNTFGGD